MKVGARHAVRPQAPVEAQHAKRGIGRGERDFGRALIRLLDEGLDGVECYYPLHSRDARETCLSLCRRRDLLVSAGSDCHGSFQNTQIGQTKTDMRDVSLELFGVT